MKQASTGILCVCVVLLLVAGLGGAVPRLDRSVLGLAGLRHWLHSEGVPVRDFSGGYPLRREGIGLRIIPVYDGDLDHPLPLGISDEERMRGGTEYDLGANILLSKAVAVPTLFVLPKWTSEARVAGAFHTDFLLSERAVSQVADRLILDTASITQARDGFDDLPHGRYDARAYGLQTLRASTCTPIIGSQEAMLLARCFLTPRRTGEPSGEALVLADPDLLNTHGLRLGDNALIARDVLKDLADGGEILIDRSTAIWMLPDERPVTRERSWADLARYLEAPFRLLWVLFAIGSALVLWRAWLRFGAPRPPFEDGPAASRAASIGAEVHLLRAVGDQGALAKAYVDARLRQFSAALFPGHAALGERRMWAALRAAAPAAAQALEARTETLRAKTESAGVLGELDEFERDLKRVKDAIERST